jgi:hypothetical protein
MTLSLTFGGTAVALPREEDPFDQEYIPFGASSRMYDATLRVQVTGMRWRCRINWDGLTKGERDALFTEYQDALVTTTAVAFPDGLTINALTGMGSWSEGKWFDPWAGDDRYRVSFTVEQV